MRPMAMILTARGVGRLHLAWAFRAPHAFQAIEFARIRAEQMDHQIASIDQHPIRGGLDGIALQMQPSLAQSLIQMGCHGLQLALHLAGRDDQAVRVIGTAGHIQHQNIFGLIVFQAFARGFYQDFQAVERHFFAALATRAVDARRGGLRFAIGLGGGGFRLGGRLGGFGGCGLGRCFGGGALWRGLGGGRLRRSFGLGRRFRLGRSGGFRLGARLRLGFCLGLWRSLGLGFCLGLRRSLGFGCSSGLGRCSRAALWAFFGRGGFAGYGRLLS